MSMTWDQVRHRFAVHQRAAGLADRTIKSRDELLEKLARFTEVAPVHITKWDLEEFLGRPNHRTGKPLSPGTKQVERSYLKTVFAWLMDEGVRASDPAVRLPRVKVPRRKPRPLRLEHIDLMLDSGAYQSTRDMITIAACTGLRVGEVVKIHDDDIDWVTNTIRSTRKGGLEHVVHMPPAVVEIAQRRRGRGWWFPSTYKNSEFPDGGGHILMKSASTRISIILRKVGIPAPITGHSLRHFYATTLLREGAPIRVVQEMMGHASLATTQLYAEVTDEEMSDASQLIPDIAPRTHSARPPRLAA